MRSPLSILRCPVAILRHLEILCTSVAVVCWAALATAQPANNAQQGNNLPNLFGGPQNGGVLVPGNQNGGNQVGRGASQNADFESLMDLITSTVSPETWADNGGNADIRPFYGGVLVDAAGTLRLRERGTASDELVAKRGQVPTVVANVTVADRESRKSAQTESPLRFVSLPRLEREIVRRREAGETLEPAMLTLAGLQRVQYVFVYPATGDLVLAGPAGEWTVEGGRIVSARTQRPVVRLDDLLVMLRREDAANSFFGCSINPRQNALEKTQAFLAASSAKPLEPGRRKKWLGDLRDTVGKQDIEIFGVDPTSRVAGVMVAADYHMKLIGMGLADGVDGVESYLDSVEAAAKRNANAPLPMAVLRWWFALNYESIGAAPDGNAFELVGQGVRVLSENEMLAQQGRRVHTGKSDPLNRKFAESFTDHFDELAAMYPVYGELRNIFDLAMAVAIIKSEGLIEQASWKPSLFASSEQLPLPQGAVPRQVETVINHRVVNRTQIVAGVSGGVMVAPQDVLRSVDSAEHQVPGEVRVAPPADAAGADWWWDAE